MSAAAVSGAQAAKALLPLPSGDAVKTAREAVEQLRKQGGVQRKLDAALGDLHDALCLSVIDAMHKCLERRKGQAGVAGASASLLLVARKEMEKAAKAFKQAGVVTASKELSRSSRIREIDVDQGWCDFFTGASSAMPLLATVEAAMRTECEGYVTCGACGIALTTDCKGRHLGMCENMTEAERRGGGRFETMTASWVVQQVEGKAEPYLRLYSLKSPLSYGVNAAMRELAFCGRRERYEPMKGFAYSLHRAILSLPKYEGTVFRAMGFRVSESLYSVGAVVTFPHPTSTTQRPGVIKDFMGVVEGADEVQGTILVLRVRTGRTLKQFSPFPEEEEVLIATNTQFRVVGRPDVGVLSLLEMALDTSLRNLVLVELQEVDFDHWGKLTDIMTEAEKLRNAPLLDVIKTKVATDEPKFQLHPVTREGMYVCYPPSTELPDVDGKTLLERAVEVEHNEQVVSLCCANLAPAAHVDALNKALTTALRLNKDSSHDNTAAVLLSKGADVASLPKELRTVGVALIACACKRAVLDKAMHALGDTFWGTYEEDGPRDGWTVLHAAAARNRSDLLKDVLLSDKLEPDTIDAFGHSACSVAAASGCVDALRILITKGQADVNKAGSSGVTPCARAAQNGHAEALRQLITEGHADVNKADDDGTTPCFLAAEKGHVDALRVIVTDGHADVNKLGKSGRTPCFMASQNGHAESLRILITEGHADVNEPDSLGRRTPCVKASENGHAAALRILITEGHADVNMADNDGATPCFMAAENGHVDALRILVCEGRADVKKTHSDGRTPCFMAAQNGHLDAIRIVIAEGLADQADNDGRTPSLVAAEKGHVDALRILITEGHADVNKADKKGVTPCFMAAQNGDVDILRVLLTEGHADGNKAVKKGVTPCFVAVQNGHVEALRILITEGHADVNQANKKGVTPCFIAAEKGQVSALRILITEGHADVNMAHNDGRTPCFMAAEKGHVDALHVLIKEGWADVNQPDNDGTTPCFMAAENGHVDVISSLITEGQADVNKADNDGMTPCFMAAENGHADALGILVEGGQADVNIAGTDGATPCLMAAKNGHVDALHILVGAKANVNQADKEGVTPCIMAAENGHADGLRTLINEGQADVNMADNDGRTPCLMAAKNGHVDALHILVVEAQADVNKPDKDGMTPCFLASQKRHTNALRILVKDGHADVDKALGGPTFVRGDV